MLKVSRLFRRMDTLLGARNKCEFDTMCRWLWIEGVYYLALGLWF